MVKLNIAPEAQSDLQSIKKYILTELENQTAAVTVISNITKTIRRLIDFPEIGTPLSSIIKVQTDYRFLVSGNYLIFYRFEADIAYIIRILYRKRDYLKVLPIEKKV